MDVIEYFPKDNLFCDMVAEAANKSFSNTPHVIFCHLFKIMLQTLLRNANKVCPLSKKFLQTLLLAICIDILFVYSSLYCMTSLIIILVLTFYLVFLWIKSCGKLIMFQQSKIFISPIILVGFAASLRDPPFEDVHHKKYCSREQLYNLPP